jgi:hypothetical protein
VCRRKWKVTVSSIQGDSIATVQQTYVHEFDAVRREAQQRDAFAAMAAQGAMAAPTAAEAVEATRLRTGGPQPAGAGANLVAVR